MGRILRTRILLLANTHTIGAARIAIWIFFRQVKLGTTIFRGPKDLNQSLGLVQS
jgi:hypothetical protein